MSELAKTIAIFGSTGSIGTQALDIIRRHSHINVSVLTCGTSIDLLRQQINEFLPKIVCVQDEKAAMSLQNDYPKIEIFHGEAGLIQAAGERCDIWLNALVGISGLAPTIKALTSGNKYIALANKETLVAGGRHIMDLVAAMGAKIIPIDSEHSAIWQALKSGTHSEISKLIITASGGPFYGYTKEDLKNVSLNQALNHPSWTMGKKITIDSATLMNKGNEVIEAKWLFDIEPKNIDVVVHKTSIVHSLVAFRDGSVIAQLGQPNMRVPISYAILDEGRYDTGIDIVDLVKAQSLEFLPVDKKTFTCLDLAYRVLEMKRDTAFVLLNAANEVLVKRFINKEIGFYDIQTNLEKLVNEHEAYNFQNISEILELDMEIRARVRQEKL